MTPPPSRKASATLDANPQLCADLSERDLRQAERFSPERFAERLGEVYRRIAVGA